jgi:hypothetical protein
VALDGILAARSVRESLGRERVEKSGDFLLGGVPLLDGRWRIGSLDLFLATHGDHSVFAFHRLVAPYGVSGHLLADV